MLPIDVRRTLLLALAACTDPVRVLPTDNELRFLIEVDVPAGAVARVTVWPETDPARAFVAGEVVGPSGELPLWGLRFDTTYVARVDTVDDGGEALSSAEVSFRTRRAPFPLPEAAVTTSPDAEVGWVLLNFALTNGSPSDLMLVIDREGEVVWYEDVATFAPDPAEAFWDGYGWDAERHELLAIIGHRRVVAMGLDGRVGVDHATTELVSHDVRRVGDRLLLPTTRPFEGPDGAWLEDGWLEVGADGSERVHWLRDLGLSPEDDPPFAPAPKAGHYWGPWVGGTEVVDWTHVNAIDVRRVDGRERVLLSLKNLDQLVQADPEEGVLDFRMGDSGQGGAHSAGDFTWVGEGTWFGGQHALDVVEDGSAWLFDNGNPGAGGAERTARALQLAWDEADHTVDTLRSHDLGLACPFRGSAFPLSGDQVLATCGSLAVLRAIAPDGGVTWEASFTCPDGWPSCSVYRGVPLPLRPS